MKTLIVIGIVVVVIAVVGWMFAKAPFGYEDETGYHDGEE